MLAPPVAALVGITVGVLWQKRLSLLALMAAVTVGFQVTLAGEYTSVTWLPVLIALMAAGMSGLALARIQPHHARRWSRIGGGALVAAMLITPAYWSAQTLLNPSPMSNVLPGAWSGENSGDGMRALGMNGMSSVDAELTAYLKANTEGMRWMMAVSSAMDGSGYVLETGRGVMLLGGFSGGDQVATPEQIAQYVAAGELRYVLDSGQLSMTQPEVAEWVQANCVVTEDIEIGSPMGNFDLENLNPAMLESMGIELPEGGFPDLGEASGPGAAPGGMQGMFGRMPQPALYDCAANES
jgi:4-amino-4-deoxy-L-arabinose transferase-like glycosyltransferase